MWLFAGAGVLYVVYEIWSRNYRQVLFARSDLRGIWPMLRHYFLFGPKPRVVEAYNPLQKLAYTTAILLGMLSLVTGVALYKPVQFHWLVWLLGGFQWVRFEHFIAMIGLLSFIPAI
jgi:thiosulfate reductase cytochrome b subunit